MGQIIGFDVRKSRPVRPDWSTQEIAEFYRVESALIQAGLMVETERGLSDEGDPWLVFCHGESGDVIVHFARIDGEYVVAAPALTHLLRGPDLTQIVRRFVAENPISMPSIELGGRGGSRDNVILHPAVLLTAFVATVLLLESPTKGLASEAADADGEAGANGSDGDLAAEHHSGQLGLYGTPKQDDDRGSSEKAFLIAAITVAAGLAELSFQPDHSPFMNPALEHDILGETHEVASQEGNHTSQIDLFDFSGMDFFAGNDDDESESAPVQVHGSGDAPTSAVEMAAIHEVMAEQQPEAGPGGQLGEIDAPVSQAEPLVHHSSAGETGIVELATPVLLSPVVLSEAEPSSASGPSASANTDSAAVAWLEKEAAASGWSVVMLDEDSTQDTQRVAEIVDQGDLVPSIMNQDTLHDQQNAPKEEAIQAFRATDDDIAVVKLNDGSVVMFDRSDVDGGQLLDMHSWQFDDHTMVSILGNADTVSHVVALVA